MRVEFLSPSSEKWRAFLSDVRHDVYHLPSYVAVAATLEKGEPFAMYVEDGSRRMLLPLILRRISAAGVNACDYVSPFGYPGPLFAGPHAENGFIGDVSQALVGALRERGGISAFVRLHPILNRDHETFRVGAVVAHGETLAIDLARSPEELWRETRHGHRYQINQALRAGYRAFFDAEWRHLDDFVRLYHDTMRRAGASPYYFFPHEYFVKMRDALGTNLHLGVVELKGEIVGAALFTRTCGIVQYHLSGTSDAYARYSPTKLLLAHARTWARETGNRFLHLGGGVAAAADSLFEFKAGFSNTRFPFRTLRIIVDDALYRRFVEVRTPDTDAGDLASYFPAYRRAGATGDEL